MFAMAIILALVFRYMFPGKSKSGVSNRSRSALGDRYKSKLKQSFQKSQFADSDSDDTPTPSSRGKSGELSNKDEINKLMTK